MTPTQTLPNYAPPRISQLIPEEYDTLVAPHLKALRRWVNSTVQNSWDTDDIIQDTLLLALRHIGQFRFEASLGTWLRRIAINVILGRQRSPRYSRTVVVDPEILDKIEFSGSHKSPLAECQRKQTNMLLHKAVSGLPATYRAVVELRDFHGLSIEATAKHLAVSKPAIKSRHRRARIMLQKTLQDVA